MNGNNEADDVMDEGVDLGVDETDDDGINIAIEEAEEYEVDLEPGSGETLDGLLSNIVTNSWRERHQRYQDSLDAMRREVDHDTKKLEEVEEEVDQLMLQLRSQIYNHEIEPEPQPEPQYPGSSLNTGEATSSSQTNGAAAMVPAEKTGNEGKVEVERRKRRRTRMKQPRSYTPPPTKRGPASADQAPFDPLIKEKPVVGEQYWAKKGSSLVEPWEKATLLRYSCEEQIKEERGKPSVKVVTHEFQVKFEDDGEIKDLSGKEVARDTVSSVRLPVSSRVLAIFKEEDSDEPGEFYPGVVGETPNVANQNRYLVFFDDTYPNYVTQENLRLVYHAEQDVWNDVFIDITDGNDLTEFLPCYLKQFPYRPMVRLKEGDKIRLATVKSKKKPIWVEAEVNEVDGSLAQVSFEDSRTNQSKCEWIYRGSPRLEPMKILAEKSAENQERRPKPEKDQVRPVKIGLMQGQEFVAHDCGPDCEFHYQYVAARHRGSNPLRIPLHLGWRRKYVVFNDKEEATIIYTAPCGRSLRNMEEVQAFLKLLKSKLEIDFFAFDPWLDVMREFIPEPDFIQVRDISFGKEKIPVSAANSYESHLPNLIQYSTVPIPQKNVHIETDPGFLVRCNCVGLCDEKVDGKFVCPCRQLTVTETTRDPTQQSGTGYSHRRLQHQVRTGIYECNKQCSCGTTCSNRVVQFPIRMRLQVFKTKHSGWGIRALDDIPQGAFICTYAGKLYTDQEGDEKGKAFGDNYFADLDLIEDIDALQEDKGKTNSDLDEGFEEEKKRETVTEAKTESAEVKTEPAEMNEKKEIIKPKIKSTSGKGPEKKKGDGAEKKSTREYFKNEKGEEETGPYVMDANTEGNIGRYFNHCCDPNLFVQNVFVESHDPRFHNIAFFAMKFVKAGEELCWDYNYEIDNTRTEDKKLNCNCGASNCRGRLL